MTNEITFLTGMFTGVFLIAIFNIAAYLVQTLQRRPVSRTEQRYTPEREDAIRALRGKYRDVEIKVEDGE